MKIIKVTNPYYEKTYKVSEDIGIIENTIDHIERGYESFLHLHDFETGNPILITPDHFASMEVIDGPDID